MARRRSKKKVAQVDKRIAPTLEQMLAGDFVSAGMAYSRIAVIDTMLKRGQITAMGE